MIEDPVFIDRLVKGYGASFYIFDEPRFLENYKKLLLEFKEQYSNYCIAYSFKTNYTPYIVSLIRELGGYAEVVSEMEYYLAKRAGFSDQKIIFNGPCKGSAGKQAFLSGSIVNADSVDEARSLFRIASEHPDKQFSLGVRVNVDVGQGFISRFGIDPDELPSLFEEAKSVRNLKIAGLHCHISRCRSLAAWKKRAKEMLLLADRFFDGSPEYIDLGSGMFGCMEPEFAAQFDEIPTYKEYAAAAAKPFAAHYEGTSAPILFTEPGTTLISNYVSFVGRVEAIKCVRGKPFAVMNCSQHNLGETCLLKTLPYRIIHKSKSKAYHDLDFTGYTCLEQDVIIKNYCGELAAGDYVIFGNVGGYSNVLKPPFIQPNCPMIALQSSGKTTVIKKAETYLDILQTYSFD